MEDYRHRPRKNTPHVIKTYDAESGSYMGRVVDITADGMMLITKDLCTVGRTFRLRIILPVMMQHRNDVVVETRVIWSEPDTNPSYCKIGLTFVNLPGEEGFLLEDIMHKLNIVG